MLVLFVLLVPALVVGGLVAVVVRRLPGLDPASPRAVHPVARAVEHRLEGQRPWQRFLRDRVDPRELTGLALTLAFVAVCAIGLLAFQVRKTGAVVRLDRSVATWAAERASGWTDDVVGVVTHAGSTIGVFFLAAVVGIVEVRRTRSPWVVPFLAVTLLGEVVAATAIKQVVGRFRPGFDPAVGLLQTSFPSGHSANAAAAFAAFAFLLGRHRRPLVQAGMTGLGVTIAALVASSRVLLTVHWFSDVVAGLLLGWAWFGLCAIAFGGRLLVFGAPVEIAERSLKMGAAHPDEAGVK